ncbi:hypothetical protein A2U01_0113234, partial [Trifolium medium]|nr:hypothetical protein [Trifolium medium]
MVRPPPHNSSTANNTNSGTTNVEGHQTQASTSDANSNSNPGSTGPAIV